MKKPNNFLMRRICNIFIFIGALIIWQACVKEDEIVVVLPVVATGDAGSITSTSADLIGEVSSDGNAPVIDRGIIVTVPSGSSASEIKKSAGAGLGKFQVSFTGLSPGVTYKYRAYGVNSKGTSLGLELTFVTTAQTPVLTATTAASSITGTSAISGGTITSDGGSVILVRGVCYGINPVPTINDFKILSGSGVGQFSAEISGLSPATRYYVRAFATNQVGTAYGDQIDFTTVSVPPVISQTSIVSSITNSSAITGGNITSDGGSAILFRGVCYSTSPEPTIINTKTSDGTGIGSFTSTITGLSQGTKYFARAYATNSVGTAYGNQIEFTTNSLSIYLNPNLTYGVVSDVEGNNYSTIQIGTQTWMAENLKVGKYRNGDAIPYIGNTGNWSIQSAGAYTYYDSDPTNNVVYGKLYNWFTTQDPRGLCPSGWHVPSHNEWIVLTNFLGGNAVAGGKMKSTAPNTWILPNVDATNSSGFSGLPGGFRSNQETSYNKGDYGFWFSSTEYTSSAAWIRHLESISGKMITDDFTFKVIGYSIRCVKD